MILRTFKTSTIHTAIITHEDLCQAFGLPDNAQILIAVPGSGDYSNTTLDIKENCLTVTFTTSETNQ